MTLFFEAMAHNRFVQRHSCPLFRCGFALPSAAVGSKAHYRVESARTATKIALLTRSGK
jgi:hypothetical protein